MEGRHAQRPEHRIALPILLTRLLAPIGTGRHLVDGLNSHEIFERFYSQDSKLASVAPNADEGALTVTKN